MSEAIDRRMTRRRPGAPRRTPGSRLAADLRKPERPTADAGVVDRSQLHESRRGHRRLLFAARPESGRRLLSAARASVLAVTRYFRFREAEDARTSDQSRVTSPSVRLWSRRDGCSSSRQRRQPNMAIRSSSTRRWIRSIRTPLPPATSSGSGSTPATPCAATRSASIARARGAWVVYGGIHSTLFPDECHERGEAHAAVRGDGDHVWAHGARRL